jgi:hypothetical protein
VASVKNKINFAIFQISEPKCFTLLRWFQVNKYSKRDKSALDDEPVKPAQLSVNLLQIKYFNQPTGRIYQLIIITPRVMAG